MKYQLPNIPAHVAGKKATLSINHGETTITGVISMIRLASDRRGACATIMFDGRCVSATVRTCVPHELDVEE